MPLAVPYAVIMNPSIMHMISPIVSKGIRIGVDRLSLLTPMAQAPHRKSNQPYKTIANRKIPNAIQPSDPNPPVPTSAIKTPPAQKEQNTCPTNSTIEKKTCCMRVREKEATEMAIAESAKLQEARIRMVMAITSSVTPRKRYVNAMQGAMTDR